MVPSVCQASCLCLFKVRICISNVTCLSPLMVSELRWEVIDYFVNIGGIDDHHWLNFLCLLNTTSTITFSTIWLIPRVHLVMFSRIHVALSLVLCVMFCRSLLVLLSFSLVLHGTVKSQLGLVLHCYFSMPTINKTHPMLSYLILS
jgi:hypothetical protein